MERMFIGLVVLFGVGFMPAEGLDSLKINLLKQKIFYTLDDTWIPPSLPNDKECVGQLVTGVNFDYCAVQIDW